MNVGVSRQAPRIVSIQIIDILVVAAILAGIVGVLTGCSRKSRTAATSAEPTEVLRMTGIENAYPRWSMDGSRILFQSNRSGRWQIYVMDRNGQNQKPITNDSFNNNYPDWSPDNGRIAFVSDRTGNQEVFVMNMDGTGLRNLSNSPARDIHPYWAPDGERILFNSDRDASRLEIYEAQLRTGDVHRLTITPDEETCARFSPDGAKIVYLKNDIAAGNDEVYVMNADGTHQTNVTQSAAADGWPSWTPDGRGIIYSADESGRFSLYVRNLNRGTPRRLTAPPWRSRDARAEISRDGSSIVFNRQKGSTIAIYTLRLR
jgi:Tol biopolymer transport system component